MGALTGRAAFPSHGLRSRNRLVATASSVKRGVSQCAKGSCLRGQTEAPPLDEQQEPALGMFVVRLSR